MRSLELISYARPDDRKVHLMGDQFKRTKCGQLSGSLVSVAGIGCLQKDTVYCEKCWPTPPVAARRR